MRIAKRRAFFRGFAFLMAVFIGSMCLVRGVFAIDTSMINRYAQNSIYFYDPTCKGWAGYGGDFETREDWDGSCTRMTDSRISWVRSQLSVMQSIARSNGLPWEIIAAQTILESGGGSSEVCPHNPLGLKGCTSTCDGSHCSFSNYNEAYTHYINRAYSVRQLKNKYPNDPYAAAAFIQYGVPHGKSYAQCSKPEYLTDSTHPCYGHSLGDPTPGYVQKLSSIICGIQKWAKNEGIEISSVTWENYSGNSDDDDADDDDDNDDDDESNVEYCDDFSGDSDGEDPEDGDLASYVRAWAWSDYQKGRIVRKQAYASYIDSPQATYTGATCSDGTKGVDCGAFVANIIKASGWDTNYVQGSTSSQGPYLASNWDRVSSNSLQLGDVGYRSGHVILYVGNVFSSHTASASDCRGPSKRAPSAGSSHENLNNYTWYRKR